MAAQPEKSISAPNTFFCEKDIVASMSDKELSDEWTTLIVERDYISRKFQVK